MNQTNEITPQEQRAAVEQELRLAKEYWLRTIQPRIAGRKLRDVELFVAQDAHRRLQAAQRKAEVWNRSEEGQLSPLEIELSGEKFHEPEVLFADENLKPEILAKIAAPLMYQCEAKMTSTEAVRTAHELLMAAERYIRTLPDQKHGTEFLVSDLVLETSPVSFVMILRSNEKDSGQLPLLPPVQQKRNEGQLSLTALRTAVKDFLEQKKKDRQPIPKKQWNDETKQDVRLGLTGSGKPMTYQEWQSEPDEAIKDCLKNDQILFQDLCTLRWERFKNQWDKQQLLASTRKPRKPPEFKKPKTQFPKSAATSPTTAGKR